MSTRKKAILSKSKANGSKKNSEVTPVILVAPLSPEREAELEEKALAIGPNVTAFPGKMAQRAAWMERIQEMAHRDAADLIRVPMPAGEPPLTMEEILGQKEQIAFLRKAQARWAAAFVGTKDAMAEFQKLSAEAKEHRKTLLRFFALRLRNDPTVRKRVSKIREGEGDARLVQDVIDLLEMCREHSAELVHGARGEGKAAERLAQMAPELSRTLAAKSLSKHAIEARDRRNAAYTMALRTDRRIRMAASYMYEDTDRLATYVPFPTLKSKGVAQQADDVVEETGDAEPSANIDGLASRQPMHDLKGRAAPVA